MEERIGEDKRSMSATAVVLMVVGIIVVVAVVGTVVFSGVLFLWVSSLDQNEVSVSSVMIAFEEEYRVDENVEGAMFRVFVTPVGVIPFSGVGTVDVLYNGNLELSRSINISGDMKIVKLSYRDFVVGNGVYKVMITVGGKSSSDTHLIDYIPESVNAVLSINGVEHDQFLQLTMSPRYPSTLTKYIHIVDVNKNYRYTYKVTDENGYVVSGNYLSYEMDPDDKIVFRDLEMDLMGNYTVEVSLETLLMKEGAEGRTVTRDPFTTYINRKPTIEVSASSTVVRPGTEVIFSLKSDDLDSNGEVLYYNLVLPDADGDKVREYVTVYKEGPTTRVKYTFDTIGEYEINFTAADNGPMVTAGGDLMIYQEFSSIVTILIEVKWLS
ncbi:MAG: hypothetical protein KAH57_09230 [Thermoplasmata archaeon]|nr:hypothetical protein [Thermoplasmata archaeon]